MQYLLLPLSLLWNIHVHLPLLKVCCFVLLWGFPRGSAMKNLPAMQEAWARSLGWEDPLEKEMATHSGILAWAVPWAEEPGRLSVPESWIISKADL